MAKEWKALWEDYDRDDAAETKKSSASKSEKVNWYYADGRKNDDDEKDRTILGFDTQYVEEDARSSSDYGGYGYSGYSGYGYYDEFDDSSSDWYRRGKFRYTRQADYSPSSQFRSTFSRYTYSGDSDAKNRAIRALRTLTRSANTIVDKAAKNKQPFAVQFSNGTDSNGVSSALTEDKQRVVFVSPDELLAASTTEAEDAVVDALTGFVLLRVQIAQDVTPETLRRINSTGTHTAMFRAAEAVFVNKDSLKGIDPVKFSQDTTDDYLAGLLAKSMLTRLARRNVVSNWGGFAPYFIRHAKKFAAVRENLEKAEKSVETIVGTLGYNMLADESPLPVDKAIEELVSKHLGAEVEPARLLDVCRELIAEIRALLVKTTEGGLPAGSIENSLAEMMRQAQEHQSGGSAESAAMREFLDSIAGAMGAAEKASVDATKLREESVKETETLAAIKKQTSLEQLLKHLEAAVEDFKSAEDMFKNARSSDGAAVASRAKNNLSYAMSSRPQGLDALKASGEKELDKLLAQVSAYETFSGSTGAEALSKLAELTKAITERASEFVKKRRAELKKDIAADIKRMEERLAKSTALTDEALDKVRETQKDMPTKTYGGTTEQAQAVAALEQLKLMIHEFRSKVVAASHVLPTNLKSAENARSASTLQKALSDAMSATNTAMAHSGHCFYDNYVLHQGQLITTLTHELSCAFNSDEHESIPKAVEHAVDATISANSVTDVSFMASLINAATGGAIQELLCADAEQIKKTAEDFGVSVETFKRLINVLRTLINNKKIAGSSESLGKEAAGKLETAQASFSPVDRHLFGDKIETKTKLLTGEAIGHVNDEARNAAEEDYVAYLSHNDCRPKVVTKKEEVAAWRGNVNQEVLKKVKTRNRGAIERIRNALQFQAGKRTVETHGLRSGDLDEGSLHKLSYDCEHIWSQKTVSKLPDVAVGILVDQSGSMSGAKIEQARELCITLAEAVQKIGGVRLYVYGHTANTEGADLIIYEHYNPAMGADMSNLGGIRAHCNNYDGYAIKDAAKRLAQDPAKRKYLFVIADGLPAGSGYGGESAQKHVTSVCNFTRDKLKIGTYAFAVGVNNYQQGPFKKQYGENHVVFVNDVMKCLPKIVRFLRNALQQERKLVGVES